MCARAQTCAVGAGVCAGAPTCALVRPRARRSFWSGSFLAGLPALAAPGVSLVVKALRAIASGLGLAGIYFIMLSATKRLETRQAEQHRPSAYYDKYFLSSGALLPKLLP